MCRSVAQKAGVAPLPEAQHQSPFTVILPPQLVDALMDAASSADQGSAGSSEAASGETAVSSSEPDTADSAPGTSSEGSSGTAGSEAVEALLAELRGGAPIWQHPPQLVCFSADRPTAKALAKQLADGLRELPAGVAAEQAAV